MAAFQEGSGGLLHNGILALISITVRSDLSFGIFHEPWYGLVLMIPVRIYLCRKRKYTLLSAT